MAIAHRIDIRDFYYALLCLTSPHLELLALKKKRTSTTSDEEEKTKGPRKTTSPNHLKAKKKKLKKSNEKPTNEGRKTKKKAKFVNPIETKSSRSLNASNDSENSLDKDAEDTSTIRERILKKLSLDTSTDISKDEWTPDTTIDTSKHNQSTDEETPTTNDSKESSRKKKPASFKPKKKKTEKVNKDGNATEDSIKTKASVVKPKKFEMTLAVSMKSKATSEKKIKKFKKISAAAIPGKENGGASQQDCGKNTSFF